MDNHLRSLRHKHEMLERTIRSESARAACNEVLIARIKKQKLHIKEEIDRLQRSG